MSSVLIDVVTAKQVTKQVNLDGTIKPSNIWFSLCAELYHWNFAVYKSGNVNKKFTYGGTSGRRGEWSTNPNSNQWYVERGVGSKTGNNYLDLGDYKSECLSDPNLCPQGLSLSFWLRYNRKYRNHCLKSITQPRSSFALSPHAYSIV